MIYLLTATGLSPVGSSAVHIYTETIHRTTQLLIRKSVGRAPSLRSIPWHLIYEMIYLLTKTGLSPVGSSTVHIYTQRIHRTTQITTEQQKKTTNLEERVECPVLASFALQLKKKHGKTSVGV